jgi:hypothetical protein
LSAKRRVRIRIINHPALGVVEEGTKRQEGKKFYGEDEKLEEKGLRSLGREGGEKTRTGFVNFTWQNYC